MNKQTALLRVAELPGPNVISIRGNDIGFAQIISTCMSPLEGDCDENDDLRILPSGDACVPSNFGGAISRINPPVTSYATVAKFRVKHPVLPIVSIE